MEAKHTRGPWYADNDGAWFVASCMGVRNTDGGTFYPLVTRISTDAHDAANAALIAAAPDMLEVAQMVVARWKASSRESASDIERAAMAALAKAEGR